MSCLPGIDCEQVFSLGRPRGPRLLPHPTLCMWGPSPASLPWHWVDTCDWAVIPDKPPHTAQHHHPHPSHRDLNSQVHLWASSHWSMGGAQQDWDLSFWSTDRAALLSLTPDLQVGTAIVPTGPNCCLSCCRDPWRYPFQVGAKQNKQKGQGAGVCAEGFAGQEAVVANASIIRARQASPVSGAPPATRLFINTWLGWISKTRGSER